MAKSQNTDCAEIIISFKDYGWVHIFVVKMELKYIEKISEKC